MGVGLPSNVPWCSFQEGSYINSDKGTELAIKPHITRNKLTKHKKTKHLFHSYIYIYIYIYCELRNHTIVTVSEKVNYYYYAQENFS
jgi:hypothetical protein